MFIIVIIELKFKINLKGRNKWLITQNSNYGHIEDLISLYKHLKSRFILPNLLKYLQKDKNSLFSYLLPEIISIINDILYITIERKYEPNIYNRIKIFPFVSSW